jgi:Spy/CpxP family protein refolding chaperone
MRKIGIIAVLSMLVVALAAVPALAQNPHFISARASGPAANGDLTVNFKIAGLGANETITVTATADATAVYACQNNAGNFPNAANKQQVRGPVSASGNFTSGQNGQITDSLTLTPPTSTLVCPRGQTRVLASISYTNVAVSGGGDTESIPGTFSKVFFPQAL